MTNLNAHAHKIWLLSLVMKHGSLVDAGRAARVSTSAVSQAISQLEAVVGAKLLIRNHAGAAVSSAGIRLLEYSGEALALLTEFDPALLSEATDLPKRLRIGAYESLALVMLPYLIPKLRTHLPGVEIEIKIDRSRELITKCQSGELDLAFVADASHPPRIAVHTFATDSYGLFISVSKGSKQTEMSLIQKYGLACLSRDDKHHGKSLGRYLKQFTPSLRPQLETPSFEIILALAVSGTMVGVLPLRVANRAKGEIIRADSRPKRQKEDPGIHSLDVICNESLSQKTFAIVKGIAQSHMATGIAPGS
jgi:DNA-binding transcriptional LysR family regulator